MLNIFRPDLAIGQVLIPIPLQFFPPTATPPISAPPAL